LSRRLRARSGRIAVTKLSPTPFGAPFVEEGLKHGPQETPGPAAFRALGVPGDSLRHHLPLPETASDAAVAARGQADWPRPGSTVGRASIESGSRGAVLDDADVSL